MMRNQIIKPIKVSGLYAEALCAAAPGNFIRTHRTISPLSRGERVLLPAGTGGEPCQRPHCKMEGSVSALLQVPGSQGCSQPLRCHRWLGNRGAARMRCPFSAPPCGDRDPSARSSRRSWTGVTAPSSPPFLSLCLRAPAPLAPGAAHG